MGIKSRARRSWWLLPAAVLCLACTDRIAEEPPPSDLAAFYRAHDYFALRQRLAELPVEPGGPEERFYRGVVEHAFNRPERSNALLLPLIGEELAEELAFELRQLVVANHFRLGRYREALAAAEALLASGLSPGDPKEIEDVRNEVRLYRALAAVGPQRIIARAASVVAIEQHETGRRVAVEVEGSERRYLLDTGANLSALMRSEAEELGLEIRPAQIEVGTSTDRKVTADLAVAGRVRFGGVELADVVFLVLPDALLSLRCDGRTSRELSHPSGPVFGRMVTPARLTVPRTP